MPRLMRNFECGRCGEIDERFIDTHTDTVPCDCGAVMQRVIGTPTIHLDGTSGHFPTAYDRWASIREKNARIKAQKRM